MELVQLLRGILRGEQHADQQLPPSPPALPRDLRHWPRHWQDEFEERSAIAEYHGALMRLEAERQAEEEIRRQYEAAKETRDREAVT